MDVNKLFRHWTYQIFFPGTVLREKYEAFKRLLAHDRRSHELLAELEDAFYQERRVDIAWVERRYGELSNEVWGMIAALRAMVPVSYVNLPDYYKKIDFYIKFILAPPDFSQRGNFDMIIIGKHGKKGFRDFFLGNVTNRLLTNSPCPVLIARE